MTLAQKIVIVTGATSGIGRAVAAGFVSHDAHVVGVGRGRAAVDEVAALLGAHFTPCVADITAASAPSAIVAAALAAHGRLDVLVNAAGIIGSGTIGDTSDAAWDDMLDLNLRAPFRLMREATPHLIASRGNVVNVSSVAGLRAFPGVLSYCVSKSGVDQLTRCAALDLAPHGVRVNAVNPGVVVSNLHRRAGMDEAKYAEFLERSKTTHPLGRPGQAEEIAALVLFLASDAAGWVTGETIAIDGGRHLTCAR